MQDVMMNSIIAGVISLVLGLGVTYLVDLAVPTTNLQWALIAVGFASFFAGFASYWAADMRNGETTLS